MFDKETGLHYNYFRDYDPSTGRYIESDPIGLDGGINTFDYANGRPFENRDVLGLAPGLSLSGSGSGYGSGYGNGGTPSGARAFENFFKTNISPVHDRNGRIIEANGQFGVGGQIHGGMKGVSGEIGVAVDTLGNVKVYRKICIIVGPGFYGGAGGSAGFGQGTVSSGPSETTGIIVSSTAVPTGSISFEKGSDGVSGSFGTRPTIWKPKAQAGIGHMCGVQKCWYDDLL